jgi:AcrR family transcriptional regulator
MSAFPPLPPARADAHRNRQRLLDTAREVFAEEGLQASLDLIAQRAGVANATLYRHFGSRDTLIAELVYLDLQNASAVLARAEDERYAWDGFVTWLTHTFDDQRADRGFAERLTAVSRGIHPEIDRLRDETVARIDRLISTATGEGRFRADRGFTDVLMFLLAHERLTRATGPASAAVSRRWLQLTLHSLDARDSEPTPVDASDLAAIADAWQHRLRGEPLQPDDL